MNNNNSAFTIICDYASILYFSKEKSKLKQAYFDIYEIFNESLNDVLFSYGIDSQIISNLQREHNDLDWVWYFRNILEKLGSSEINFIISQASPEVLIRDLYYSLIVIYTYLNSATSIPIEFLTHINQFYPQIETIFITNSMNLENIKKLYQWAEESIKYKSRTSILDLHKLNQLSDYFIQLSKSFISNITVKKYVEKILDENQNLKNKILQL